MASGVNSPMALKIPVELASQFWLRKGHPGWHWKYSNIFWRALDGRAELMIFLLSSTVFGASGAPSPSGKGPCERETCNGNGALY